jgi:hypothetical protein
MGQKSVRFGTRRDTRSRQDESIEVSEVGSKRPSLGGTGGHACRSVDWADFSVVGHHRNARNRLIVPVLLAIPAIKSSNLVAQRLWLA